MRRLDQFFQEPFDELRDDAPHVGMMGETRYASNDSVDDPRADIGGSSVRHIRSGESRDRPGMRENGQERACLMQDRHGPPLPGGEPSRPSSMSDKPWTTIRSIGAFFFDRLVLPEGLYDGEVVAPTGEQDPTLQFRGLPRHAARVYFQVRQRNRMLQELEGHGAFPTELSCGCSDIRTDSISVLHHLPSLSAVPDLG